MNTYLAEEFTLDINDPVDRVVCAILDDVTDRRGWRHEWDGFDDDVKREIVETWRARVRGALDLEMR